MAKDNFGRYVWLIDLLQSNEEMTFKEISAEWQTETGLNPGGEKLALRTFHNHIQAIKEIFDIEIYYRDGRWQINPQSWINMSLSKQSLLAKLSLNNAILEFDPLKERILYEEDVEPNNEFLRLIALAMNKGIRVTIDYQRFGGRKHKYHVAPYCLKMHNHRWYLLGAEKGTQTPKVFAMDKRMTLVELPRIPEPFTLPKGFNGKKYFDAAVGVIVNPGASERIRIKAYGVQADYLRSSPLHHSQKEVAVGRNYTTFELQLNPNSIELEQLLFSKIDQIEVLSPESLRNKMIKNLEKMRKVYSVQ